MLGLDLEEGRKDAGVGDSPGSRAGAGTARSQAPSPGPWRNTLPQVPHLGRNYSFRGEGSIQEGVGGGKWQAAGGLAWLRPGAVVVRGQKGSLESGKDEPSNFTGKQGSETVAVHLFTRLGGRKPRQDTWHGCAPLHVLLVPQSLKQAHARGTWRGPASPRAPPPLVLVPHPPLGGTAPCSDHPSHTQRLLEPLPIGNSVENPGRSRKDFRTPEEKSQTQAPLLTLEKPPGRHQCLPLPGWQFQGAWLFGLSGELPR